MLDKIMQLISFGKKKNFEDMPSWALVLIGVPSFLFAGYFGLMFVEVIPKSVEATNKEGLFNLPAITLWGILGFYGAWVWMASCTTKRCHDVLYSKWFK